MWLSQGKCGKADCPFMHSKRSRGALMKNEPSPPARKPGRGQGYWDQSGWDWTPPKRPAKGGGKGDGKGKGGKGKNGKGGKGGKSGGWW